MRPSRPTGTSESARFWQWAFDSIEYLQRANLAPGVLTSKTTRGIFRRMMTRQRGATVDDFPYIGFIYEEGYGFEAFGGTISETLFTPESIGFGPNPLGLPFREFSKTELIDTSLSFTSFDGLGSLSPYSGPLDSSPGANWPYLSGFYYFPNPVGVQQSAYLIYVFFPPGTSGTRVNTFFDGLIVDLFAELREP